MQIEITNIDDRYQLFYVDYEADGLPQSKTLRKVELTQYIKDSGMDVFEYRYGGEMELVNIDPVTLLSEEPERIIKAYLMDLN
jgi:hypothetical protein